MYKVASLFYAAPAIPSLEGGEKQILSTSIFSTLPLCKTRPVVDTACVPSLVTW